MVVICGNYFATQEGLVAGSIQHNRLFTIETLCNPGAIQGHAIHGVLYCKTVSIPSRQILSISVCVALLIYPEGWMSYNANVLC